MDEGNATKASHLRHPYRRTECLLGVGKEAGTRASVAKADHGRYQNLVQAFEEPPRH